MISVHPCRNKLFKARNWIWRGEGGTGGKVCRERYKNRDGGRKKEDETNPSGREETERVYDSPA